MFSGYDATLLAGGHTHIQMLRRYRDQIIINPGSIGLPVERTAAGDRNPPWAEYAVLTVQDAALGIELRRVPIDVRKLKDVVMSSGMPDPEWYISDWK